MRKKKVLVSGCFDLLHPGHVTFFKQASHYGELYVAVGTDENVKLLKGKTPYFSQWERLYMVRSIRYVHEAFLASGSGILDFEPDLLRVKPDRFIVNADGHTPEKELLCRKNGIEYIVLDRVPEPGLPARASSEIKKELGFPYRLCLAGGWLDQPWMSELHHGPVIVTQIKPTIEFQERSGMGTSSRKVALELWGNRLPDGDPVRNAKLLFGAENPPGSRYISGSQDHLGLLLPGINRLYYEGDYWPSSINSITDPETCRWLESVLHLILLRPRPEKYDPLEMKNLTVEWVRNLAQSGELCWKSIQNKDVRGLGLAMSQTMEAWKHLLPRTVPEEMEGVLKSYASHAGAVFSGSGGGYLIVASDQDIPGALKVQIGTSQSGVDFNPFVDKTGERSK